MSTSRSLRNRTKYNVKKDTGPTTYMAEHLRSDWAKIRVNPAYKVMALLYLLALMGSFAFLLYDHYKYPGDVPTPQTVKVLRDVSMGVVISLIVIVAIAVYFWMKYARAKNKFSRSEQFTGALAAGLIAAYFLAGGFWAYSHFEYQDDGKKMSDVTNVLTQISMYYVVVTTMLAVFAACVDAPWWSIQAAGCGDILVALASIPG